MPKAIVKLLIVRYRGRMPFRKELIKSREQIKKPLKDILPIYPYDEELVKIGGEYRFAHKIHED